MVALADIGPLTRSVPFRGQFVDVRGVSALEIFGLLEDYPELKRLMTGKPIEGDIVSMFVTGFPGTVASIICAGCDKPDDAATKKVALTMTAGEQALFLKSIIELTFPQGLNAFLEDLNGVAKQVTGGRGWGQVTRSPAPSSSVSQTDTSSNTSGNTPPDNSKPGPNSSDESKPEETSLPSPSSDEQQATTKA